MADCPLIPVLPLPRFLSSVSMKDVQGKCSPKTRRGRLFCPASTSAALPPLPSPPCCSGIGHPSIGFLHACSVAGCALWHDCRRAVCRREGIYPGETGLVAANAIHDAIFQPALLENETKPFRHFVFTPLCCCALPGRTVFSWCWLTRQNRNRLALGVFLLASSHGQFIERQFLGLGADDTSSP